MIVTADELKKLLPGASAGPENLRLLDVRSPRRYRMGHIPGAVNVPISALMELDGSAHAVAGPDRFQETMRAAGVGGGDRVVVYGERGGMDAAYLYWALEYYGHDAVAFLDGGIEAWQAAGGELTAEETVPVQGDFVPRIRPELRATAEEIAARLSDGNVQILDTRTPQEFTGEFSVTERGGHIPGALRIDWDCTLSDGYAFKPADVLRAQLEEAGIRPDKETYLYCLSGPRAAHLYIAMKHAGYGTLKLYDRSWSEWGNRRDLPVATAE